MIFPVSFHAKINHELIRSDLKYHKNLIINKSHANWGLTGINRVNFSELMTHYNFH